jgi:hypothetical protein
MNPFSGFLQPAPQRPLDISSGVNDILRTVQQQKEMKQRQLENTQQNALAQAQSRRGDAQLALQQGEQAHRFTAEDQKQVEGLLAEYHDALDTGDQERVSRASQMLKRFGMDVQTATAPGSTPDLKAFTGQSLLPKVQTRLDVQAFTGEAPTQNPIDQAVQTEMASRDALRARNAQPEPELSQQDFEQQLINGTQAAPSRYEEGGKTTEEFKKQLPQSADEPVDMGDVDSPAFQAAAKAEGNGVVDLDKENPAPFQIGSAQQSAPQAPQAPPRLPTQLLPTIISKGGKVLEQSNGAAGRYGPMVSSVFEPFTSHENPELAQAAKMAQAFATRKVAVDGVSPDAAIKAGIEYLTGEANRLAQLERTKIGSKAHVMGPGGAPGWDPQKDKSESIRMYAGQARTALAPLNKADAELAEAAGSLSSDSPAAQRDALMKFVQARSGATVSDRERGRYDNLDGPLVALKNRLSAIVNGQQDANFNQDLLAIINRRREFNQKMRNEIAQEYSEGYGDQNDRKAPPEMLEKRKGALKRMILSGGGMGTAPGGEDEESLY